MQKYLPRIIIFICGLILIGLGSYAAYAYTTTPSNILHPESAHYHFRLQLLVNGKAENFGDQKYQTPYDPNICSGLLTESPIHFHDNKDQFVHIHWKGVTGGEWLKNYGWNFIGGLPNALGYQINNSRFIKVKTFGDVLPEQPEGADYYIFVGDEKSYIERDWDDFITMDLEQFFQKPVTIRHSRMVFVSKAYAQESHQEHLEKINSFIGNIVIFVQNARPSDEQIKAQFNQILPLPESTCGG